MNRDDEELLQRLLDGEMGQEEFDGLQERMRHDEACLLYTSPSPRDS